MKRSVVIRGAITHPIKPKNHLKNTIDSIRSWFDGEIVVATWPDQQKYLGDIKSDIDKVVIIDDPGPGPIQNITRQILSFKEGVENCSGEEILVTRPDITFSKNIFEFIGNFEKSNQILKFVDEKIIVGNIMTINPDSFEIPNTFRVSDWFHCGRRKDIKKLYAGLDEVWSVDRQKLKNIPTCTEKMWFLSVLSAFFPNINILNSENIDEYSWDAIVNNFVVLNSISTLGTYNFNYPDQPENMYCYMTEDQYKLRHDSI